MFTLLAGFLAMFIDSITVLLFFAMVTIELARLMKFDSVPIIIAEKEGYKVSWGRYLRYALPAMILVAGICWVMLILRYA
jgi:Na+/H+ antiporter NhaD/arsenite permease-like protein